MKPFIMAILLLLSVGSAAQTPCQKATDFTNQRITRIRNLETLQAKKGQGISDPVLVQIWTNQMHALSTLSGDLLNQEFHDATEPGGVMATCSITDPTKAAQYYKTTAAKYDHDLQVWIRLRRTGSAAAQNGGKPNPFNFRIISVFPDPNNVLEDGWVHKADITIEFTTQKDGTVQYAWCSKAGGKALPDTCRVPDEQSYDGFSMLSGFGALSAEGRDFVFWDRKFCPADASDHNGIPNSHRCFVWAFHATAKVTLR